MSISKVRRTLFPCLVAGIILGSGCGTEPTRPPITSIALALSATPEAGDPSTPVSLRVTAKNTGDTRVVHCTGCGCDAITITVLGPDGTEVALSDPKAIGPLCPIGNEPMSPGETLQSGVDFTGVLYLRDSPEYPSPTYAAPPGTYTVIARFTYLPPSGPSSSVERRTTFVWRS